MIPINLNSSLLNNIDSPKDLKLLSVDQLPQVCQEIRDEIIHVLSENPGHLGSSLGAVELAVAIHYVYNTPEDRIVWDVGHQAYAHKILTGRRESFHTNRTLGGLRPFPSPFESEYDTNTCGHASNSISVGLGMAVAAKKEGLSRKVVAIIGDGAMSGGLAFERLNNVSSTDNDMLIILNDNNMSIDNSVGGMKQYLLHLHTSQTYNNIRFKAAQRFASWGWLNEHRKKAILRFNNSVKSLLFNQQNIFEGLDIRYFGPMNGNNVINLVRIIQEIKEMKGPKLLHIHTTKGKGYQAAEKEATIWHAPGKFDVESGKRLSSEDAPNRPKYQTIFGKTLIELAQKNDRIVGVTPAMPTGCSMDLLQKEMPDRVFDVGIAEGHSVTFSAGMAKDGLIPFCNIYSSFAQRAYDNIIHDVAISNLPVVICLDRAGLVGEDGPTHHGAFDLAFLRPIPNLTIASPMDGNELRDLMYTAQLPEKGAFIIRYPRGCCTKPIDWLRPFQEIRIGSGRLIKKGNGNTVVLSVGPIGTIVEEAITEWEVESQKNHPEQVSSITHYDMRFIKPLDEEILQEVLKKFQRVITIEDGVREGGFGSAVLEYLSDHQFKGQVIRLGLPDQFVEHGKVQELYHIVGLDKESIKKVLL